VKCAECGRLARELNASLKAQNRLARENKRLKERWNAWVAEEVAKGDTLRVVLALEERIQAMEARFVGDCVRECGE
jgi:chemotaxis regulatin CheY-phosphate phosphatase CheZ